MAAADKICDYSGEYVGADMHKYSHNNIQVRPEYRKAFKGQKHTLIIRDKTLVVRDNYGYIFVDQEYLDYYLSIGYKKQYEYEFSLHVPELPGCCGGYYDGVTTNLSATKRKLKRYLGCRKLNVEKL